MYNVVYRDDFLTIKGFYSLEEAESFMDSLDEECTEQRILVDAYTQVNWKEKFDLLFDKMLSQIRVPSNL